MANLIKYLIHGYAPDIKETYLITDKMSPYTKNLVTQNINRILDSHKSKRFKIGKTGDAEVRADQVDYRKADYDKMYVLYQHTSKKVISDLEKYYINKCKDEYPRRCKNVQMHSGGDMFSNTAYYYVYMVI